MFKTREALIPYLIMVSAAAAGLLWHESDLVPGPGRTVSEGQANVGGPFRLTDQDEKSISSSDFLGWYQPIYFGYSYCPDVCLTTLEVIADALSKLGPDAGRLAPIFITVDPTRDTPAVLKKYLAAFDPRFIGLTGSQKQIAVVEREFRVFAQKVPLQGGTYGMNHSSGIYLMDPRGRLVTYFDNLGSPAVLANSIKAKI